MIPLPRAFLDRPLAHRALHDQAKGRPENSLAAIRAAVEEDYGVEVDLQLSRDGEAMVFHDDTLDRLTAATGPIRARTAAELSQITLNDSTETIPTLSDALALIAGRVPLLLEIKDQDGALGPDVGPLEQAVAAAVASYDGPVAAMSFNPHSVAALARHAPDLPRGLVTEPFAGVFWPNVPQPRRAELAEMPDLERVGASFISHQVHDLQSPAVARVKARGLPVLCWTVRSPQEEARAREVADNITFEGYLA